MATFKVQIGDKTHEVEPDAIQATEEGYGIVTPDNVPDGYYTQKAMEQKIKDRLKSATSNAKDELKDDESFHREVLNKYNVALDSDGNPKGLKPTVDVDEAKKQAAESVRKEYENKLEQVESKLSQFKKKGLKGRIVENANKLNIDNKFLEPLVEGGDPYLVKELEDNFTYNDEVDDYVLLEDDKKSPKVDGNGFITVDKFFEKNSERFKPMQKDTRQRGSNFSGFDIAGNGTPKGNPAKWSRDKKLEVIKEHGRDGYKEMLNNYKESQKAKQE